MIEVRHLMRKHVLLPTKHGRAMTYRCMECGANGANTPDGIYHYESCRYAILLKSFGEPNISYGRKEEVALPAGVVAAEECIS